MTRAAAALLALLAILSGCTRGGHASATGSALVIAQQREPLSLNPALENGVSSIEWGMLLFQYLVKYGDGGELVPDAALEVPTPHNGGVSADGLTITYHLRPHLRFADGTPLTARDCVWSVRAIQNPANNVQSRYGYDRIVRAEAPDDTTLVLHLRVPFAPLITLVLAPAGFPILPAHLLARYHDFNHLPFDAMPVGSGPYVVTQWQRADRVVMRANPYYWQGKPAIDRLEIRFAPDPNTAINLLRTGEAGGFYNDEDLGNYPILKSLPGIYVANEPINAVGAIVFNTQAEPTNDAAVRHALAEAIDIRALIAKTYRGAISSDAAGRGLFIWAYDPKAYPDIPFDPAAAARELDAAGWHAGPDGWRVKNGRVLDVLFIIQAQTPGDQIAGNMVADFEKHVGARVTLKQYVETQFVAPADMGGPVYGGKFSMALYPFVNGDDPDTTDQFACANVPPRGYNKSRICDPEIDRLLEEGRRTYDRAARLRIYRDLQRRLYALLPVALLDQRREVSAFTTRLHGQTTSLSGTFWNVGKWTLGP